MIKRRHFSRFETLVSPISMRGSRAKFCRRSEAQMGSYQNPTQDVLCCHHTFGFGPFFCTSRPGISESLLISPLAGLAAMFTLIATTDYIRYQSPTLSYRFQPLPGLTFAPENGASDFSIVGTPPFSASRVNTKAWLGIRRPKWVRIKTQPKISFVATTNLGSVRFSSSLFWQAFLGAQPRSAPLLATLITLVVELLIITVLSRQDV